MSHEETALAQINNSGRYPPKDVIDHILKSARILDERENYTTTGIMELEMFANREIFNET